MSFFERRSIKGYEDKVFGVLPQYPQAVAWNVLLPPSKSHLVQSSWFFQLIPSYIIAV
jgi:hypothetical protein